MFNVKNLKLAALAALTLAGVTASADIHNHGPGEEPPVVISTDWGGAELQTSIGAAMTALTETAGAEAVKGVTAVDGKVSTQKNSAKVKVTYTLNMETKTLSLFCHNHGDEIDCH